MTDWLARAKAQFAYERPESAAITDETHHLSVSSVAPAAIDESRGEVLSVSSAGVTGSCKSASLDLSAAADRSEMYARAREAHSERSHARAYARETAPGSWTDVDIARFLDRRARLMRWGWSEPEAEKLAERLVRRDREGDDRVSCTDCRHYRPGRCGNREAAGLHSQEVGRDLAALLQRCDGFTGTLIP